MCGIAGIFSLGGKEPPLGFYTEELRSILTSLAHRGPDGTAIKEFSSIGVLGANRLAIVDRHNPSASMPIISPNQDVALVMNGEIYNHKALRAELAGSYKFSSDSDSEVALAAYLKFGESFPERLIGMFAILICDNRSGKSLALIDRIGEKPLYFFEGHLSDQRVAIFSSELRALLLRPKIKRSLNFPALQEAGLFRFSLDGATPYKEIRRISPGELLVFHPNGKIDSRRYWEPRVNQREKTENITPEGLGQLVEESGAKILNTDEPLGVLLSGGLDSTIVTYLATKQNKEVHTFSIGFKDEAGLAGDAHVPLDEFKYSNLVARVFNTKHHEILIGAEEYWDYFDLWCEIQSDPLGVEEAPCLLRLFKEASSFCRIVASGSGADECLEGYGHTRMLPHFDKKRGEDFLRSYLSSCSWFGDCDPRLLVAGVDPFESTTSKMLPRLGPVFEEVENGVDAVQYLNVLTRLHAYELRQLDLASMHYSIEARSPLADYRFIEMALSSSADQKICGGVAKKILIDAFYGRIPKEICERKKEGFPIPTYLLFSKRFESMVGKFLSGPKVLGNLEMFDFGYLAKLWSERSVASRMIFYRLLHLDRALTKWQLSPSPT